MDIYMVIHMVICLSIHIRSARDIRSDIFPDSQSGNPAGSSSAKQILHLLRIHMACHRDQSERGALVACVFISHHCRDSCTGGTVQGL
jgi:hypothetical protein